MAAVEGWWVVAWASWRVEEAVEAMEAETVPGMEVEYVVMVARVVEVADAGRVVVREMATGQTA